MDEWSKLLISFALPGTDAFMGALEGNRREIEGCRSFFVSSRSCGYTPIAVYW